MLLKNQEKESVQTLKKTHSYYAFQIRKKKYVLIEKSPQFKTITRHRFSRLMYVTLTDQLKKKCFTFGVNAANRHTG